MKLLELHIRNIASIEKADIDFENGLNDAITGEPASIFWISGDTGAGKSVILDSISMALYKTTPRIEGVANPQKNEFTDAKGESIKVTSIEQYTRLGISVKDECYSEVMFEGNDHKTYQTRLTLGIYLGNTDKTTGIRPLKYKRPKWEMQIDHGGWVNVEEKTILNAIGLGFQQFGRMAMLAQGQFANFLTGDKKEREDILEQLTNTQHFSEYGNAIKSLYDQAREAQALVQTQYNTEKSHTLTDDEVKKITEELNADSQQKTALDKRIKTLEDKLKLIEEIQKNEKIKTEAQQKKQYLEAKITGEEYRRHKALFTDWDATAQQRQQLFELQKARQNQVKAKADLVASRGIFNLLSADLEERQNQVKTLDEQIKQTKAWLEQRKTNEILFTKAGEVDLKIEQYLDKLKKESDLTKSLKEERNKTEELKKAKEEACATNETADKAVKKKQNEIEKLNQKRTQLQPQTILDELGKLNTQKQHLNDLKNLLENQTKDQEEHQRLGNEIQKDAAKLKTLKETCIKVDADFQNKKKEAEKATNRLNTMKMSVDETIKELRHRLYNEHSSRCPLCGQQIDHIHLDDDFKDMLTPLEAEQKFASEKLQHASELRDQAISDYKQLAGTLQNKNSQLDGMTKKISKAQQTINTLALQTSLDPKSSLTTQIEQSFSLLESEISKLETTQKEAERLLGEINKLLEAKKPLDVAKMNSEKAKTKAENDLNNNAQNIDRLENELKASKKECDELLFEISTLMASYSKNWHDHIAETRQQLKADAEEYSNHQKLLNNNESKQEKARTLINSLSSIRHNILVAYPEWDIQPEANTYYCADINEAWTNLFSKVNGLVSMLNEYNATINSNEKVLKAYYEETGKDEEQLNALMAKESEVAVARKFVNDIDAQLKSRIDTLKEAQQQIDQAMTALGITETAALPDKPLLELEKDEMNHQREHFIAKISQSQTQLDTNQKNNERLKELETQLELANKKYHRWDTLNRIFGGNRFRTLVQTYILRPLLNNANIYLEKITDRYALTCSEDNEQLSILVLDRYNKNQIRSVTVLSGGERFMISLALSLALSSLNRPDMNINILFIDEGFGTLDEKSLESVMSTLEKLQEIAGQNGRRVGIISHRKELIDRIPVQIHVAKKGEGRSMIEIMNSPTVLYLPIQKSFPIFAF